MNRDRFGTSVAKNIRALGGTRADNKRLTRTDRKIVFPYEASIIETDQLAK